MDVLVYRHDYFLYVTYELLVGFAAVIANEADPVMASKIGTVQVNTVISCCLYAHTQMRTWYRMRSDQLRGCLSYVGVYTNCLHKLSRPPDRPPASNSSSLLRYLRAVNQGEIFMPGSTDERSVSLNTSKCACLKAVPG